VGGTVGTVKKMCIKLAGNSSTSKMGLLNVETDRVFF
jgi:hypothetical protein